MSKPVWGCPWHGKVQGGQLLLPNGQSMAYPQPAAKYDLVGGVSTPIPDTWGAAHRVAVPGTPVPVRSTEEQAADAAAGRQWRNTAILSGGRQALHGTLLDGWVYTDPDGARWRVSCQELDETVLHSFAASMSATVTLARFGEFGAAAESYSFPITCAWGLDGTDPPTSGRTLVDAIKSDGSGAIVMVHERRVQATDPQIRWPHAFLEIAISGPGASASVSCSVIKARTAALSATVDWPPPVSYLAGYYTGPPAYASDDWRVQLASTPPGPGEGNFSEWGGKAIGVYSGAVSFSVRRALAIWYDTNGVRIDVDHVINWAGTLDMPLPAEPGTVSMTGAADWSVAIEVGGVAVSQVSGAWSATTTENPDTWSQTVTETVDGEQYVANYAGASSTTAYVGLGYGAAEGFRYLDITANHGYIADNATTFSGHLAMVRYSPQVLGLRADRPAGYAYHPPATPSGTAGGITTEADTSRKYGAWDPDSGVCAWLEINPVCYV